MFGGKNSPEGASSSLKILQYDYSSRGLTWIYPSVKGVPPKARYHHNMVYYPELECLMVVGGISVGKDKDKDIRVDHFAILNLETLVWSIPHMMGREGFPSRFGHCSCIYNEQLMVFGGKAENRQFAFGLDYVELSNYHHILFMVNNFSQFNRSRRGKSEV